MHWHIGLSVTNNAPASVTGGWSGQCLDIWTTNQVSDWRQGDNQLGDTFRTTGWHL